jgi:hypothetical protein
VIDDGDAVVEVAEDAVLDRDVVGEDVDAVVARQAVGLERVALEVDGDPGGADDDAGGAGAVEIVVEDGALGDGLSAARDRGRRRVGVLPGGEDRHGCGEEDGRERGGGPAAEHDVLLPRYDCC